MSHGLRRAFVTTPLRLQLILSTIDWSRMENTSNNSSIDEFEKFASFLPDNLGEFEERFTAKVEEPEKITPVKAMLTSNAPWHNALKIQATKKENQLLEDTSFNEVKEPLSPLESPEVEVKNKVNNSTNNLEDASLKFDANLVKPQITLNLLPRIIAIGKKLLSFEKLMIVLLVLVAYHFGSNYYTASKVTVSNASITASGEPVEITKAYQELTQFANSGKSYLAFSTRENVITIKQEGSVILVYKGNGSCWFAGMVGAINSPPLSDPAGVKCSDAALNKLRK